MHPDTPSQWFKKFLSVNDLRHIRFHDLRHTHATILLTEGTPVNVVTGRLDHRKASTTISIYGHSLKAKDIEAAAMLDNLLK